MKNCSSFLTTKGIVFYLASLGILQGALTIQVNFKDLHLDSVVGDMVVYFFLAGLLAFITLAEIDLERFAAKHRTRKIKYPVSTAILGSMLVILPIHVFSDLNFVILYVSMGYIIPAFLYFNFQFIRKFSGLHIVHDKKPSQWILGGIVFSFLGLILNNPVFWNDDNFATPLLNSGFMLVSGVLMAFGWQRLPSLSELGWLSSLDQLFVLHYEGKIVLYTYHFQHDGTENKQDDMDDIKGGYMIGLDSLFSEILESEGHIKEIIHDNKTLPFTHGKYCTFILFAKSHFEEPRFRLDRFAVDFEQHFAPALAGTNYNRINAYLGADQLVARYFA